MKSVAVILAVVALCVAGARAQGSCPLTAESLQGLNFGPVGPACNGLRGTPSADDCDTCSAELFRSFIPTLASLGYTCNNFPTDPSAITNAITPCVNIVLPALQRGGVQLNGLLALRSCSRTPGPKVQGLAKQQCPAGTAVASQVGQTP